MTKEELCALFIEKENACAHLIFLGRANINGVEPEKRVELDLEYKLAAKKFYDSRQKYDAALELFNNQQPTGEINEH